MEGSNYLLWDGDKTKYKQSPERSEELPHTKWLKATGKASEFWTDMGVELQNYIHSTML